MGSITKENDRITKITVVDLKYPKIEGADGYYVTWDINDMIRIQVEAQPNQILGTIHSHPNDEPHISKADIETAEKYGEVVSGIFSYWGSGRRRRTSLDLYYGPKILAYRTI